VLDCLFLERQRFLACMLAEIIVIKKIQTISCFVKFLI